MACYKDLYSTPAPQPSAAEALRRLRSSPASVEPSSEAGAAEYDRAARSEGLGPWQAQLGVKWAEANADLLTVIGTMLTPHPAG